MPEHHADTEIDEGAARAAEERSGSRHEGRGRDLPNRWRFDDAVQAAKYLGSVTR
ncbi:MAG TPA: hypothetical protein VFR87_17430 [Nocardioidaceae bacterium]|nr:hypothetical protein [Nocardioidaceae bacterium]